METEYATKEESERFRKVLGAKFEYFDILFIISFGLILIVPIFYSISAKQNNLFSFYSLVIFGFALLVFGFIKYSKWRKKYSSLKCQKRSGLQKQ